MRVKRSEMQKTTSPKLQKNDNVRKHNNIIMIAEQKSELARVARMSGNGCKNQKFGEGGVGKGVFA